MSKKDVIIPLVPAALSALLLAGGVTVFSACDPKPDGTWMHCHQCQNSVVASAAGLAVFFGTATFVTNKAARLTLQGLSLIGGSRRFLYPRCHLPDVHDEDDALPYGVPAIRAHHECPRRRHWCRGSGQHGQEGSGFEGLTCER